MLAHLGPIRYSNGFYPFSYLRAFAQAVSSSLSPDYFLLSLEVTAYMWLPGEALPKSRSQSGPFWLFCYSVNWIHLVIPSHDSPEMVTVDNNVILMGQLSPYETESSVKVRRPVLFHVECGS